VLEKQKSAGATTLGLRRAKGKKKSEISKAGSEGCTSRKGSTNRWGAKPAAPSVDVEERIRKRMSERLRRAARKKGKGRGSARVVCGSVGNVVKGGNVLSEKNTRIPSRGFLISELRIRGGFVSCEIRDCSLGSLLI